MGYIQRVKLLAALKKITATDKHYPLFHVQNSNVVPKVRKQTTYDPAGIYFFFKDHPPEGGVYWSDWKFAFEAKVTPTAKILQLDKVTLKESESWLSSLIDIDSHDVLCALCNVMVEQENWDADHYAEIAADETDATIRKRLAKRAFWYHVLKAHFNDSAKLAAFFLSKGFNVLEDHNATIWDTEKDQLVALKKDAVKLRPIKSEKIRQICG